MRLSLNLFCVLDCLLQAWHVICVCHCVCVLGVEPVLFGSSDLSGPCPPGVNAALSVSPASSW